MSRTVKRPLRGWLFVALAWLAGPLRAGDGRLEINQACVAVGCFPGDAPGFPVTITAPGSYVLTDDLSVSTAANGIDIEANHVTLDLNGFSISGDDSAGTNGICAGGGRRARPEVGASS